MAHIPWPAARAAGRWRTATRLAMPLADRLLITEVDLEPEGDVTFPRIDALEWVEVSRDKRDGFSFVEYRRR